MKLSKSFISATITALFGAGLPAIADNLPAEWRELRSDVQESREQGEPTEAVQPEFVRALGTGPTNLILARDTAQQAAPTDAAEPTAGDDG